MIDDVEVTENLEALAALTSDNEGIIRAAIDHISALRAENGRYKAALADEIKFLETCFDTWMDREHLERHISRMCAALTAGEKPIADGGKR